MRADPEGRNFQSLAVCTLRLHEAIRSLETEPETVIGPGAQGVLLDRPAAELDGFSESAQGPCHRSSLEEHRRAAWRQLQRPGERCFRPTPVPIVVSLDPPHFRMALG